MNKLYASIKGDILRGDFHWLEDEVYGVLLDGNYILDIDEDKYLRDIPKKAIIAYSKSLEGKRVTKHGAADAEEMFFEAVPWDREVHQVVLMKRVYHRSKWRLICVLNKMRKVTKWDRILYSWPFCHMLNFPFVTTGGDIYINWSKKRGKIFRL